MVETDGGDDDGTIIWEVLEFSTARLVCRASDGVLSDAATGRALLEAQGGDVYYPGGRSPAYSFVGDQVLGADGSQLLETDPGQESASDLRKLVIAALVDAQCNSAGTPR